MIKYIGSKRRLVPVLGELLTRAEARSALDLFTGTTRVAQEWKRRGAHVTAVDSARYAAVLADCFIATDAGDVDLGALREVFAHLDRLPGKDGYVTETFSRRARYFQEPNAQRIDAVRDAIEREWASHPWRPVLLAGLLLAADRVDSTTGVQMAYLKQWSPRSYQPLELKPPELLGGPGASVHGDATKAVGDLPAVDLAYLDPPYNQHRYAGNYHVWETLVAWDSPEHYGVACKRIGLRGEEGASVFNRRREAPAAMASLVESLKAEVAVISGSDEGWIPVGDLADMASRFGTVQVLAFESKRYVGAQIGIYDLRGKRVGRPGRARNTEYLVVAGPAEVVSRMCAGYPRSEVAAV
ncbi:MAG TPA: DNA adenine methylase [Acidimicrobiales bacterium]|nr:DNA adenine methylase [Acidimicrobiales bacterium]